MLNMNKKSFSEQMTKALFIFQLSYNAFILNSFDRATIPYLEIKPLIENKSCTQRTGILAYYFKTLEPLEQQSTQVINMNSIVY